MALTPQPRTRGCCQPDDASPHGNGLNVADILLVGADTALLEGIMQALSHAGHHVVSAGSLAEAAFVAAASPPLLAVVDRALLAHTTGLRQLGVAPGGAVIVFGDASTPLSGPVRRQVLAELRLPLERARLMALVTHVELRAHRAGRQAVVDPQPEL